MRALLASAMFFLALLHVVQAHAQPANVNIDRAAWGVLADLAERDFVCGSPRCLPTQAFYFRWQKPNEILLISQVVKGGYKFTMPVVKQTDGSLEIAIPGSPPTRVGFEADGSFSMSNQKTFWLLNLADGTLNWSNGYTKHRADARPLRYVTPAAATDKERAFLDERRIKLGLSVAARTTQVAMSKPAPVVMSEQQPSLETATVITNQPVGMPSNGKRIALVVGNAGYGAALGSLANPIRDATAIAAALRASGFDVEVVTDADQRAMKRAIIRLGQRLSDAGRGTTGLFYFAGHGMQSRGTNFLVPVGATIEREADVDVEAVAADAVLRQLEDAGAGTSIVILDACRNLPVQRAFRDASRGLARMDAPNGSFVAYSTAPGQVAADGAGANSPFASALIDEMAKPGQPIEAVFRNVRRAVSAATKGTQTPWDSSSLFDSFVFNVR